LNGQPTACCTRILSDESDRTIQAERTNPVGQRVMSAVQRIGATNLKCEIGTMVKAHDSSFALRSTSQSTKPGVSGAGGAQGCAKRRHSPQDLGLARLLSTECTANVVLLQCFSSSRAMRKCPIIAGNNHNVGIVVSLATAVAKFGAYITHTMVIVCHSDSFSCAAFAQ